jgi:hypothetical protein
MALRYSNNLEVFMQLKDFISNALIEICSGIAEAKAQIGNHAIAPCSAKIGDAPKENTHSIEQIGFEICVTIDNTNSSKNTKGFEIGVLQVVSAKIGKNENEESKLNTTNVNKITFSVPYMPALINKSKN